MFINQSAAVMYYGTDKTRQSITNRNIYGLNNNKSLNK